MVTGAFLITATDFTLPDIREDLRVQRKYNSTSREAGLLGPVGKDTAHGRLLGVGLRRGSGITDGGESYGPSGGAELATGDQWKQNNLL